MTILAVIASEARQSIDCMDRRGLRPRDNESGRHQSWRDLQVL